MNVLITTLGSYGDVYPFVGLGVQLNRRGHFQPILDRVVAYIIRFVESEK